MSDHDDFLREFREFMLENEGARRVSIRARTEGLGRAANSLADIANTIRGWNFGTQGAESRPE